MRATDLPALRRHFITALAADEELCEQLILKGGNALCLVHRIGLRASVDIDYSIQGDTQDPSAMGRRIFVALRARLDPIGYVLFDERFAPRPSARRRTRNPRWGGYIAEFKLIARARFDALEANLERVRRESLAVSGDPQAGRKFRIEISTFEYCAGRTEQALDSGLSCYVYTPQMIAAEKLRSLCQQMSEYRERVHPAPRARDFYDLHALLTEGRVELSEEGTHEIVRAIFAAKDVPTSLLPLLGHYRDFHRSDWPAVLNSIPAGRLTNYDFYVDFVIAELRKLQPLWEVDAP